MRKKEITIAIQDYVDAMTARYEAKTCLANAEVADKRTRHILSQARHSLRGLEHELNESSLTPDLVSSFEVLKKVDLEG